MNNKTYLPLIELIIMIAIFAVASALCLQGFAFAENISRHLEAKDRAVTIAENAAEELKHAAGDTDKLVSLYGGETDGSVWRNFYDRDGHLTEADNAAFLLEARINEKADLLVSADVKIISEGQIVFQITVGWQEEK